MSISEAWRDGWSRVARAPWIVAGGWAATIALALPMALVLRGELATHLGSSLAAAAAADGVNYDWWNEFLAQAPGVGQTFVPAILGFAAVLKNLSGLADATPLPSAIVPVIAAGVALSIFLSGGILDRLARNRAIGSYGFFAACGMYFFRFLRLGIAAGIVYWDLFTWLHPLLLDRAYHALTRDVTVERTAFVYRLALYLIFFAVVAAVNVLFDYAKIRMVVEDRRSAIGGLTSAARFILRQPGDVVRLYLLNTMLFMLVLALYAVAAPGASGGAWAWLALLIGQAYIAARVCVRTLFAASQIALFQGRLAHAGYTAAPIPVWPDSPSAEAIHSR
jgi:hypothetical protein